MLHLVLCCLIATASALNIVSNGPNLKKKAAMGASTVKMPLDIFKEAFRFFDADGNGYLSKAEVATALDALGHPVDASSLDHSFSLMDANSDGKISFEEFKAIDTQSMFPSLATMSMRDNDHIFDDVVEADTSFHDKMLAAKDPKKYCADRCLSTGHCEVLEDFLSFTTKQVQAFCDQCVGEEECPVYA